MFDSTLAPPMMFTRLLSSGAVTQPFELTTSMGSYWLTRLKSATPTPAMLAFETWILPQADPLNAAVA